MATLHIKVVPGASRDRIAGRLGEAIKVQVSAAPERGKANDAVIKLIADKLRLRRNDIEIVHGHTQARKTLEIQGISQEQLEQLISEIV